MVLAGVDTTSAGVLTGGRVSSWVSPAKQKGFNVNTHERVHGPSEALTSFDGGGGLGHLLVSVDDASRHEDG